MSSLIKLRVKLRAFSFKLKYDSYLNGFKPKVDAKFNFVQKNEQNKNLKGIIN